MNLVESMPQFSEKIERGHFLMVRFKEGSKAFQGNQIKKDALDRFIPAMVHFVEPFRLTVLSSLLSQNVQVSISDYLEGHVNILDISLLRDADFELPCTDGVGINPAIFPESYSHVWKVGEKSDSRSTTV